MAYKINWSMPAVDDLQAVVQFIAHDSELYAADMAARIVEAVDRLADFPTIGRHVPHIGDDQIREVLAPPYRVLYRFDGSLVTVGAIVHGARDLPAFLIDRRI